jgi:adenylosuccinate synthase
MTVQVVIGGQFGDEAKGKISDELAATARYVVRTSGGPNAGHTIVLPGGKVVLHQLSAGVLRPETIGISGPGMVLEPFKLRAEIEELDRQGFLRGEIYLSDRAHLILPLHEIQDGWEDELRAHQSPQASLGTTRRGIGPAYADRTARWGVRLHELRSPDLLRERLELLYETKRHLPNLPPLDDLWQRLVEVGAFLHPYVQSVEPILWEAHEKGEGIVLEGAQSALLDLDFGTYPYVTSSHPTSAGALIGSGLPPQAIDEIIGVLKAYATRVGAGPFPTEVQGEIGERLQRIGGERGATTGRPRQCGWLDLVLLRYAARFNGFTSLAITKVDVLGGLSEVPVCVEYRLPDGRRLYDRPPTGIEEFRKVEPVYERLPGWPELDERWKRRLAREGVAALPRELLGFVDFVSHATGIPVRYVTFGPERGATIRLHRPLPRRSRGTGVTPWSP